MRRSVLPVAVKVVSGAVAKTEDAQVEFLREVAYLRSLLSPNIVQFQVRRRSQFKCPCASELLTGRCGAMHDLLPLADCRGVVR